MAGHYQSDSIGNLALALAKAQGEMGAAAKDASNPHFRSKYADLSSIMDACREPLSKHGLAVTQLPGRGEDGSVQLTTILMHESGEHLGSTISSRPAQENPQVVGSILTYLRRYALASVVGVVSDDDDGEAASAPARQQKPAPREQPPARFTETVEKVAQTMGAKVETVERIAPINSNNPPCPVCSGDMWDNRPKKASGAVNPKAPDFGCKNKACTGRVWKAPAPSTAITGDYPDLDSTPF
jgi:hypothetical protein